jgi:tricorn protease
VLIAFPGCRKVSILEVYMKSFIIRLALACLLSAFASAKEAPGSVILREPSISDHQIIFSYGNQLWSISHKGGVARQLTRGTGNKRQPFISPDGKWIAYTGQFGSISNVYVMPASGGNSRRLTFSSFGFEEVAGWTPDSQRILFRSVGSSPFWFTRLFTIAIAGGLPQELPLPEGVMGSFSPDGQSIAYVPVWNGGSDHGWQYYRGGKTARIWIAHLADSSIERIPRENSNDFNPLWANDRIYFLSDRNGPVTLFVFDLKTRRVSELLPATGPDIKWAAAAHDCIVYEQLGSLYTLDLSNGKITEIKAEVNADLPQLATYSLKVGDRISSYNISPTGAGAVFEAHGEIFSVSVENEEVSNLTNTSGVAERDPAWSPDGRWIAYFSDETGEYALHLQSSNGATVRKIKLGEIPSFFYSPQWSPDSTHISYMDARLNLWYVDVRQGTPVKVATDYYVSPFRNFEVTWSPDSRWIAYTKQLPNYMHALFFYSLESGKTEQVTDGMSDVRYPVFDNGGKYLYFTAANDLAQTVGWLDLSSYGRTTARSVYLVLLRKDLPNPFATKTKEANPSGKAKAGEFGIDLEGLNQRIEPLPVGARNFADLQVGEPGMLYMVEVPLGPAMAPNNAMRNVFRFEIESRRFVKLIEGVSSFQVSFDGKSAICASRTGRRNAWSIAKLPGPTSPGDEQPPALNGTVLKTDKMAMQVNPREEWKQIYREAWRIQRDFFYDPHFHGLDWRAMEKQYEPYLNSLSCREDLNYLLTEIFGQLGTSHIAVTTPDQETSSPLATGFLGADYEIENGRYRIKKIYKKEVWDADLRSPLADPGVDIKEGDYLLAVNGRELRPTDSIFEFLQGTAGKPVVLKVSADASGRTAREVTVVPTWSEFYLRAQAWEESKRRLVNELSNGRIGYIPVPDTRAGGYRTFNQYFFAQLDKQAVIIDERFNRGGFAPDYMVNVLRKPVLNYWFTREGHSFATPMGANPGPKILITNAHAGSGGDALAWYFHDEKIGRIVGTRTAGAIVGTYDYPKFIDGSELSAAQLAPYDNKGQWVVENRGVLPDVELDVLPREWREGHDPQLEKAVELLLEDLKENPFRHPEAPNTFPRNRPDVTAGVQAQR